MAYELILDPVARAGIDALPVEGRSAFDSAVTVIELFPWRAPAINEDNPDGEVRQQVFASLGTITYLIVEHDREVHVLLVYWLD